MRAVNPIRYGSPARRRILNVSSFRSTNLSFPAASLLRMDMISGKDRYTKAVRYTSGKLRAFTYREYQIDPCRRMFTEARDGARMEDGQGKTATSCRGVPGAPPGATPAAACQCLGRAVGADRRGSGLRCRRYHQRRRQLGVGLCRWRGRTVVRGGRGDRTHDARVEIG